MEKIKIALVGCGNVGQVIHLPILKKMHDVEIAAVVDPDERKAKAVALRFGIPQTFKTIDAMLNSSIGSEISAVDICTSTDQHKSAAIAAMEAGKDALVEKPIARTLKEAKEITDCAKKYDRKLMVGMNNRFRPDTMILKSFIENGELGKYFISNRAG
jgi:predicted dehydrogenase